MTNGPITMWIPEAAGSEVELAAAATVDIGAETSPRILITGSGQTITSFGAEVNRLRFIRFEGANAIHLTGQDALAVVAGDGGMALSDANGVWVFYQLTPLSAAAQAAEDAAAAAASAAAAATSEDNAANSATDAATSELATQALLRPYVSTAAAQADSGLANGSTYTIPHPTRNGWLKVYTKVNSGSSTYIIDAPSLTLLSDEIDTLTDAQRDLAIALSSRVWDFTSGSLPGGVTILRGTTANYWNSSGVRANAAVDTARFGYDPSTLKRQGLILEKTAKSIQSAIVLGDWTALGTTLAGGVADPAGGTNGITITEAATTATHSAYAAGATIPPADIAAVSVFLKAGTRRYVQVYLGGGGFADGAFLTIDTTTMGIVNRGYAGVITLLDTEVQTINGGWYKISFTFSNTTSIVLALFIQGAASASAAPTDTYLGDITKTIIAWSAEGKSDGAFSSQPASNFSALWRWNERLKITLTDTKSVLAVCDDGSSVLLPAAPALWTLDPADLPRPFVKRLYGIPGTITADQIGISFAGDSMTDGFGNSLSAPCRLRDLIKDGQNVPVVLNRRGLTGCSWNYYNGVSGAPANRTLIADGPIEIDPAINATQRNYLIGFAGTNGLALLGNTAAQEYAAFQTWIAARISAGWSPSKIFICTMLPRQSFSEVDRAAYNALLVGGVATYGYTIVRLDLDASIGLAGQQNDVAYFQDTIHPTDAGAQIIANLVYAQMFP